jgi:hypothetical protein
MTSNQQEHDKPIAETAKNMVKTCNIPINPYATTATSSSDFPNDTPIALAIFFANRSIISPYHD